MLNHKDEKNPDVPAWLLQEEIYTPPRDRDHFINKSIFSVLSVLSKIKAQDSYKKSKYSISALLKVIFTFVLIVLLSLSQSFTFVIILNVYLLAVLCLMDADKIVKIIKVSIGMTIFTFIILLPSVFLGSGFNIVMITIKMFATITAMGILSHSTRWNEMTRALKQLHVSDIFIVVLDITMKYIVMLGDLALNMFYALKLRSVGRNKSKYSAVSGIAGTIFIKSKEMADDMYAAMECRGFTGEYYIHNHLKIKIPDFLYTVMNVGIIVMFVYFERVLR